MGKIILRKDKKKRVMKRGESQRADGKYQYKYFVNGKAKFLYSWKLQPTDRLPAGKRPCLSLRELEKQLGFYEEGGGKKRINTSFQDGSKIPVFYYHFYYHSVPQFAKICHT